MATQIKTPACAPKQDDSAINCPFYGRAYFEGVRGSQNPPFVLYPSRGNQCALITDRHSPCVLAGERAPVDWRACLIVRHARAEALDD
jgi:hypothetical protein